MILEGNSRGGAKNLADHLMSHENDHVTVHDLRGFSADDLHGALNETYAISRATQCKQFLYSLSLNPPTDARVSSEEFEAAIDRAEERLGLSGQPRAIVFHEKEGPGGLRRHAHAVWSRIDGETMTARNMSFDRDKLQEVSRELYREHGWRMPEGFADRSKRDPRNYNLAEWQQAKRHEKHPDEVREAISDSWAISDSVQTFSHALKERGFYLAQGNRRGFVAVDTDGEVHSIARRAEIKTKQVNERLGDPSELPNVEAARDAMAQDMNQMLGRLYNEQASQAKADKERLEAEKQRMIEEQRAERQRFDQEQQQRHLQEQAERQERFRRGILGLWDRITGEHRRIAQQNRLETEAAQRRDGKARDKIIFNQIEECQRLAEQARERQNEFNRQAKELESDKERFMAMRREETKRSEPERSQPVQMPQPPPEREQAQSQSRIVDQAEEARQRFIEQRRREAEQSRSHSSDRNGPEIER